MKQWNLGTGLFNFIYFSLISSWMVYFILLSGLVIFWSIRNINGKSKVLLSIGFLVVGSKGVDKLLIWEFKFKNCEYSLTVYNTITKKKSLECQTRYWILCSWGKEWWFETSLSILFGGPNFYIFIVIKRCIAILRSTR